MSRLIDADALKVAHGMKDDCADCDKELRGKSRSCEFDRIYSLMDFCGWLDDAQTIEPGRENGYRDGYKRGKREGYKKGMAMRSRITLDVIKDFHDYQVGWLTSHNDITLSPEEENLILNFLHDTEDCYVLEVGALK